MMIIKKQKAFLTGWKNGLPVAHHHIKQERTKTMDYVTEQEFSKIHNQFINYLKNEKHG